ncbi:hypothetical protein Vafri_6478 [Volvox africanus]|uniref:Nucleolar complex-associated protein 3 N-terminal domain-containing protein n=1 Tax=Volvox africanus TaxID=51714 RepID=A0A8J4B2V0_9CHLO|nr:hypothetical protein Vafri_6478 [Volvox africanus]
MNKRKITDQPRGQQRRGRSGGANAAKRGQAKNPKPKPKSGGGGAALQDVPLVGNADDSDASDLEISEEDLDFVESHKRRLGFLKKLNQKELDESIRAKQERQVKQAAEARQQRAAAAAGGDSDGDEDDVEGARAGSERGEDVDEDDAEEEAYERAPRRVKDDPRDHASGGLPIKTLMGDVVYDKEAKTEVERDGDASKRRKRGAAGGREAEMEAALADASKIQVEGVTITDDLEAALADSKRKKAEEETRKAREAAKKAAAAAKKAEEAGLPPALRGLNLSALAPAERRARLQEVIAVAAQKLLAAPESSLGELRTLQALVREADSMTSRLALLSLFAVFKDILPGYRIRPPTEKELEVKVSKEVAKLREYEQNLLKSYQTYLRSLLDAAQCVQKGTGTLSHSRVAMRCLTGLLTAHPHFNYTSDILQAVVPRMASQDPETRSLACEAIRGLLEGEDCGDEGGAGKAALEAVQLVADLIRTRKCVAPPEMVRTLSVLRFRDVTRPGQGGNEDEEAGGKRKKGHKAEKRDAKRRKKDDEVARAFKESAAGPDKEEAARLQSSMLEGLFEIYFRVLKHCCAVGLSAGAAAGNARGDDDGDGGGDAAGPRVPSASSAPPWTRVRVLKKCPLLHPVLDGLARYTHLISVDYMNDLMAVFSDLLAAPGLPLPERLRVLATMAALLRGQGEALNVDRRGLYVQLYDTLLQVPFHSLLTDEGANQQQRSKQNGGGVPAGHKNDDDEDSDTEIAAAAACDRAADAAAAPPPPQAAAVAAEATADDGETHGSLAAPSVAVLLSRVLEALLCEPKMADMQRTAAFVKRMAGVALMAGPGEAMALWATIGRLLRRYPKLANLLEYEGEAPTVGGRTYDPYCTDPSESGALATTLWEVCFASGSPEPHYHPHLAQAAGSLMALRPGAAAAAVAAAGGSGGAVHLVGPLGTPATITELADAYDASRGLVRPPPPPPRAALGGKKGKGGRRGGRATAAALAPSLKFLEAIEVLAVEYGNGDGWDGMEIDVASEVEEDGSHDGDERKAAATATATAAGPAAAALRRMFLESQRFQRNKQLRRDKALLVEQLKRFHIHLQERQVAEAQAAAAAAKAAAAKAAAAAAAAQAAGRVPAKKAGKKAAEGATAASQPIQPGVKEPTVVAKQHGKEPPRKHQQGQQEGQHQQLNQEQPQEMPQQNGKQDQQKLKGRKQAQGKRVAVLASQRER